MGILESNSLFINKTILYGLILLFVVGAGAECQIPNKIRGAWFSWENGKSTLTEINAEEMAGRGVCVNIQNDYNINYTMILRHTRTSCYHCVKLLVRTVNVLDKMETPCVNLAPGEEPTVDRVCEDLNPDQKIVTLFKENYVPINCRSSLEGVWQFTYQNRFRFTGECDVPDSQIRSCQTPAAGTQSLNTDQKFNITYKSCQGISGTFDRIIEYRCLGDWFVGKNHFFAVANTKESREDEKYRCFLQNRDYDSYIGASITAECNVLKTPEESPEILRITPIKSLEPGCRLPQNISGDWSEVARIDPDMFINETHIIETGGHTIYACRERHDSRVMMARLTEGGCQKDFVCFDFTQGILKGNHIIEYRRSVAKMEDDFQTVCSRDQFKRGHRYFERKHDSMIARNPVAKRYPIAGNF